MNDRPLAPITPDGPLTTAGQQSVADGGLSAATVKAYNTQWDAFDRYAFERGQPSIPATPGLIVDYLAWRRSNGASLATLQLARSAIHHKHALYAQMEQAAGRPRGDNPAADLRVRAALRTHADGLGFEQRQARGLRPADLDAIERSACQPRVGPSGRRESAARARTRGLVDIALVRVMFDGLLRRGEAARLTWGNLRVEPDGSGRLLVARLKVRGRRQTVYMSHPTMAALAAIRPEGFSPDDRIFDMNPDTVARRIRQACEHAGLPPGYSGHSARVGMAQELAAHGTELPALATAGGWRKHDTVIRYVAGEEAGRSAVARYYQGKRRPAGRRT